MKKSELKQLIREVVRESFPRTKHIDTNKLSGFLVFIDGNVVEFSSREDALRKLAKANFTGHEALLNFLKDGGIFAVLGFSDLYYARGIDKVAGEPVIQKAKEFAKSKGRAISIRMKDYPGTDTTNTASYNEYRPTDL